MTEKEIENPEASVPKPPDKPPKKVQTPPPADNTGTTAPSDAPKSKRGRRSLEDELYDSLVGLVGSVGLIVSAADPVCGEHIVASAESFVGAWIRLARKDKRVARVLRALVTSSAWGEVTIATLALILPILAHHGFLPAAFGEAFARPAEAPLAPVA